ncbi:MAG: hypothetical protein K2Q12_04735 [Rickettsiales bacterium]|nr:hypothetical protein [Rickettsiales bacterium]
MSDDTDIRIPPRRIITAESLLRDMFGGVGVQQAGHYIAASPAFPPDVKCYVVLTDLFCCVSSSGPYRYWLDPQRIVTLLRDYGVQAEYHPLSEDHAHEGAAFTGELRINAEKMDDIFADLQSNKCRGKTLLDALKALMQQKKDLENASTTSNVVYLGAMTAKSAKSI